MSHLPPEWNIEHLRQHLQFAVDLEFWTIPFYMSAMYSIKDPSAPAYRLIQSVVYQEMLHVQLAANVANAYGLSPTFRAPVYQGTTIPHLNFNLDTPNPTEQFSPYSAEIGPLDAPRLNAMCLIEYPEWRTGHSPNLQQDVTQYGSIGEFYDAVLVGATELAAHLQGGHRQVNYFQSYYANAPQLTVSGGGKDGLEQAATLIAAITEQGEGQSKGDVDIPAEFQNTADGFEPSWPHFRKFHHIREHLKRGPETYDGVADPDGDGKKAQDTLVENFTAFRGVLEKLFSGESPSNFWSLMATLGGNIRTCWQKGAIPKFS